MLTPLEMEAVKESIRHWEEDIVKPLENGDTIVDPCDDCGDFNKHNSCDNCPKYSLDMVWKSNGEEVKYTAKYCALCKISDEECDDCPFVKYHGNRCDSSFYGWDEFVTNYDLKSAKLMVAQLKAILK